MLSIMGASVFIAIVNPIIAYNFKENKTEGNRWMKWHLVNTVIIAEAGVELWLLKPKKIYLVPNMAGKKYWDKVTFE